MGVSATSSGCNVEPSYSLLLCLSFRICKLRPTRAGWCTVIMKMGGLVPCGATQDGRVMVESSDKKWSTGEGNGKPLQYSCLENPMNSMKRQKMLHRHCSNGSKINCEILNYYISFHNSALNTSGIIGW